jgi:hypothetical protein
MTHNTCICVKCEDERRDAKRYRWLRDSNSDHEQMPTVTVQQQNSWGRWLDMPVYGAELDSAIDSAMSNASEEGT